MIYVYNNQFGGFHALLVYVCNVIASYGYFLEEKKTVFVGHEILMPQNLFKFIGLLFTTTQDFYTNSSSELNKVLER